MADRGATWSVDWQSEGADLAAGARWPVPSLLRASAAVREHAGAPRRPDVAARLRIATVTFAEETDGASRSSRCPLPQQIRSLWRNLRRSHGHRPGPRLSHQARTALIPQRKGRRLTAIKWGTASTEAILRRFTESASHPTFQAMLEVGRAQKTVFAACYPPFVGAVAGDPGCASELLPVGGLVTRKGTMGFLTNLPRASATASAVGRNGTNGWWPLIGVERPLSAGESSRRRVRAGVCWVAHPVTGTVRPLTGAPSRSTRPWCE
ncbi:Tn3 family transposase [Streptosporangium canum]|uniref:Tn3 family transposase n=1 Tax=Streptosporangium canum TaxID=324952 RepID=UPI0037BBD84C